MRPGFVSSHRLDAADDGGETAAAGSCPRRSAISDHLPCLWLLALAELLTAEGRNGGGLPMDKMENHLRWFTLAALSIVVIGVVGLMALTAYAFLTESNAAADLRTVLVNNVAGNFGVPAAAL